LRFARGHSFGFIDRPLVTQRIMSDSTLGRHEKTDALMLATQFIREKHALLGDPEAVAAVRKGIAIHSNRLGHCYLNERRTLDSAAAYFKGFFESRDLGLLARAPAAFLPDPPSVSSQTVFTLARSVGMLVISGNFRPVRPPELAT
jgi:hypothetical protein